MAEIYLVLMHDEARDGVVHTFGRPAFVVEHQPHHEVGIGGHGHDLFCHCLIVRRETYRTREEADEATIELGKKYPNSFCWSLGVKEPE